MKRCYKMVTPRERLRDAKPLDASEFAVHLDHVRDGRALTVNQAGRLECTLRAKSPAVERGAARLLPPPTHPPRR